MEREADNLISGRRRKVNGAGQRQDRIVSGNYFRSLSSVRLRKKTTLSAWIYLRSKKAPCTILLFDSSLVIH